MLSTVKISDQTIHISDGDGTSLILLRSAVIGIKADHDDELHLYIQGQSVVSMYVDNADDIAASIISELGWE